MELVPTLDIIKKFHILATSIPILSVFDVFDNIECRYFRYSILSTLDTNKDKVVFAI